MKLPMQKVLIVAYFFPPCNLTASSRPAAWARYLPSFGYYPIVITRNWDVAINKPSDMSKSSGSEEQQLTTDFGTIFYLPYQTSLKDKLYSEYGDKFKVVRKSLSFIELLFQNFFLNIVPFNNFYYKAIEIIENNPGLNKVIITANPFVSFFIGYRLKKKFPHVKWIADYRDDWNTTELVTKRNFLARLLHNFESRSEKKWVDTASLVTTISSYYQHKISSFTGKSGKVLLNGFGEDDLNEIKDEGNRNELTITYNGTLYPTQPIELFLDGFKKAKDRYAGRLSFRLFFPGLGFDPVQSKRVKEYMKGYEDVLQITERVPRAQVFKIQNRSHVLLMIAHKGIKGIPSSKVYEYLCFKKPILLCPNDFDILEQTLSDTESGIICDSQEEVFQNICDLAEEILETGKLTFKVNENRIMNYSRRNQTKVLAEILDTL
jgi:hypothetical protein